jgi:Leucine-rich repeat (LRR) protein
MTTFQEYLDQKYPTKEAKEKVKKIFDFDETNLERTNPFLKGRKHIRKEETLDGGKLDLKGFKNLEIIDIASSLIKISIKTPITNIDLSHCDNLREVRFVNVGLTSADFLNTIPNPEKLTHLSVSNNNIQPTDIEIFSKFVNLEILLLGVNEHHLEERNRFYGSFKSWKDLSKLEWINIEATDIDRGLEWLPLSLVQSIGEEKKTSWERTGYSRIQCSPHGLDVGCKKIQDALRPYDYDLTNLGSVGKVKNWEEEEEEDIRIRNEIKRLSWNARKNEDYVPFGSFISFQTCLEFDYPSEKVKKILKEILVDDTHAQPLLTMTGKKYSQVKGENLDLSGFTNLNKITIVGTELAFPLNLVNLRGLVNLKVLRIPRNNLVSVDFLKWLPNPEKLEYLDISDNRIEPTTLDFLRPFVNLKECYLGEDHVNKKLEECNGRFSTNAYNKFYGSLEPIRDLTKLEQFCIAGTDVSWGLEYLPSKIKYASSGNNRGSSMIDCQPLRGNARVKKIQDQLKAFNYDVEAWQLAHPHLTK